MTKRSIFATTKVSTQLGLVCLLMGMIACDPATQIPPPQHIDLKIQEGKEDGFAVNFLLDEANPAATLRAFCEEPNGCVGQLRVEVVAPDACSLLQTDPSPCVHGMDATSVQVANLRTEQAEEEMVLQVSTLDGESFVKSVEMPLVAEFQETVTIEITRASGMPALELRVEWQLDRPDDLPIFFDDFTYTSPIDAGFREQGWRARAGGGGPGPAGVQWEATQVEFIADPDDADNTLMRLIATTDGTLEGTTQAEVYSPQRFFEGTYAARVRFTDSPASGPDVDGLVQTFFSITPWSMAASPDYSEVDFEYLPNGGWGQAGPTLWQTTWETAEPARSISEKQIMSHEGWQTLAFVVAGDEVHYFVNGVLVATHGGEYYPESSMGIHFNHWFIGSMLDSTPEGRVWHQDIDWVLFAPDIFLLTDEVITLVNGFRMAGTPRHDSVAALPR